MKKKKGFTLIELIAVLVILAILALIVTPLVMNIIKKSKDAANSRSVDAYARALELAVAEYSLDTGKYPTSLDMVEPKYKGNKVICNVRQLKENGDVYLSECTVNGVEVKDSKTDDGWYHYGTRDLTDEEYVDMYGKAIEKSVKIYYNETSKIPNNMALIDIIDKGKDVDCDVKFNFDTTVYMTNCSVDNIKILDSNEEDGYYHYGKEKLSGQEYVDMYGLALEEAIRNYYSNNNSYPSDISNLEINYNGEKLHCDASINYNGTVFLTSCTANGVEIKNSDEEDGYYHYGENKPNISLNMGDIINYKGNEYYAMEDSDVNTLSVKLLKKTPIKSSEINEYLSSTEVQNRVDLSGTYAIMAHFARGNCVSSGDVSGCNVDYAMSDIKQVIDIWATHYTNSNDLVNDETGYKARLITYDELTDNLGYDRRNSSTIEPSSSGNTPSWVYSRDYSYWTMSAVKDSTYQGWIINTSGYLQSVSVGAPVATIRPVIVVKKSVLG